MEISILGFQTEEFRCQNIPPGQHGSFVFCFAVLGAEPRGPLKSDKYSTANSISTSKVRVLSTVLFSFPVGLQLNMGAQAH